VRFILAVKILLFTVIVPGSVTLYFPYSMLVRSAGGLHPANWPIALPAGALVAVGLLIYLRCAWDFATEGLGTPAPIDPPKHLVVTGLYRRTRNPMYQGVALLLFAECLLFLDSGLSVYAGVITLVFHLHVVLFEEPALGARFGSAYADYCRKVPRWGFAAQPFSIDGD